MAHPKRNKKGDGKGNKNPNQLPNWFYTRDPAHQMNVQGQAARDVRLSVHPQIEALNRLRAQSINQYRDMLQRSNSNFGQELGVLRPLQGNYKQGSQDIANAFGGVMGALGQGATGGSAAENAAGRAVGAAQTQGMGGVLAAGQNASLNALQSAIAGGAMQRQENATDIAGQRADQLDQYAMQKQDIFGQMPALIRQRLDQLQQDAFNRSLALEQAGLNRKSTLSQIAGNQGTLDFLKNYLGGIGNGNNMSNTAYGRASSDPGANVPGANAGNQNQTGGDKSGVGHGNLPLDGLTPFQLFTQGHEGWRGMTAEQHQNAKQKIEAYFNKNRQDPAFAAGRLGQGPYDPMQLINAIRAFYYGPHGPGQKPTGTP